jgi:hypothetical protein
MKYKRKKKRHKQMRNTNVLLLEDSRLKADDSVKIGVPQQLHDAQGRSQEVLSEGTKIIFYFFLFFLQRVMQWYFFHLFPIIDT